jgi:hypothetical protein
MRRRGPRPGPFDERFWSKVEIRDPHECWLWVGVKNNNGYGMIRGRRSRRSEFAHRVAYRLALNAPVEPEVVMHLCDEPLCCNPLHLRGATQAENLDDCRRKGRSGFGGGKLTADAVRAIRCDARTYEAIGAEHGISQASVSRVKNGLAWKDVR